MTMVDWLLIGAVMVTAMLLSLVVSSLRGRPLHRPVWRPSRMTSLPH